MQDERFICMTEKGYKKLSTNANGEGLHWTCDIHDELPIRMEREGNASLPPKTMCEVHQEAVLRGGDKPMMHCERNG